ncbi:MAG: uroporphyrinogen decarboxylase family protein [Terriglobia bacterium]|jgi:MtaA/CmuA family methyltransferase
MNSRERVFAMLDGRPVDCLPVMPITMMFATDQIGAKYFAYTTDYHVLAEAQIRTAEEFDFDHVSAIAETREAPDCGATVEYFDDHPASVVEAQALLADKKTLAQLKVPDPLGGGRMLDRIKGIALLKQRVGHDKIVEGWMEGPCGASADLRGINTLMVDFYDDPVFVRDLFDFVFEVGMRFARAQLEAGADVIGIGDPAASLVGPKLYQDFVWPYEKMMVDGLHALGARARLHICGNTRRILKGMGRLGCDFVDVDSLAPLLEAREKMGPRQVVLGNLDPVRDLRNGTPQSVFAALAECHRQAGPRYIVGVGCEVPRDTPAANVHAMVRYARQNHAVAREVLTA